MDPVSDSEDYRQEGSGESGDENQEGAEKMSRPLNIQGLMGVFSFMNKIIEEEPETSESQSAKSKESVEVVTDSSPQPSAAEAPRKKAQNIPAPIKETKIDSTAAPVRSLESYLMDPIEMLQVTDDYELELKRNKRQSKKLKEAEKQRQLEQRNHKRRQQSMEIVFNAVSSYFC